MEVNIYFLLFMFFLIFILGFLMWKFFYETYVNKKERKLDERLEKIESEYKQKIEDAKKEWDRIIQDANNEAQKKLNRVEIVEERVSDKENKLDKELEDVKKEKENLKTQEEKLKQEVSKQEEKLSEIAKLSPEEAKERLFELVQQENEEELQRYIYKYKQLKKEYANKEASAIISKVLPRVWMNEVSEFTVSVIDLPSEESKWKIIWKEWRNISYFERLTWAEIIIDESPLIVNVSCFDPEKRFIAEETLKKLVKDWRINPVYIDKAYNEVVAWMEEFILDKWKDTLNQLNLPMMHHDILYMIGQFYFRYSYWQNLLLHSMEVARISEGIANEMWLNGDLAKKAWILHDIWKIKTSTWMWHAKVWAELLKQYQFEDEVINAAEGHHFDVDMKYPISWIVTAADAISAWRPWARFNTKNMFIERMEALEKLVTSEEWVQKAYIMQAWREIMTFVDPEQVSDIYLENLIKKLWEKIESHLDYPGNIRIVAIRESKAVSYVR